MNFELFQTCWNVGLPVYVESNNNVVKKINVKTNNDKNVVKEIDDTNHGFMHIFQHYYFHKILLNFVTYHY